MVIRQHMDLKIDERDLQDSKVRCNDPNQVCQCDPDFFTPQSILRAQLKVQEKVVIALNAQKEDILKQLAAQCKQIVLFNGSDWTDIYETVGLNGTTKCVTSWFTHLGMPPQSIKLGYDSKCYFLTIDYSMLQE